MDNRSTTRIGDLPHPAQTENITMSKMPPLLESIDPRMPPKMVSAPAYQPLQDVHPNPYGIKKPDSLPDFSINQDQQQQQQYPLPSRDIPRDVGRFQDEQARANYIPNIKTNDFITEQEEKHREQWETTRRQKHRLSKLDRLVEEFQTPFFVAMLFFVFQLTIFHTTFFKFLSFMPIFHADGTKNIYGQLFVSFLFGIAYYMTMGITNYFSEP